MTAKLEPNRSTIVLLIACLGIYFLGMSAFGITDPGEGYYVEAAREMVESSDFITPHLNYQIYFSKPILTFWLIAVPYKIFGVNEFAARVSFSFIATLLVFLTYWTTRLVVNQFAALMAGLVVATAPLIVAVTRLSPIDITFTCFLDAAVFSFALSALMGKGRWWIVFYAALALAVLTKGPAAVIIFLLGLAVFLVVYRPSKSELAQWFIRIQPGWGSLIFWAIVLPWHIAVQEATNGLFLLVFFFYENLARFAGHTNLAKSDWWYYFPVIGYGFAPWIIFLPPALKDAFAVGLKRWTRAGRTEPADASPPSNSWIYSSPESTCILFFAVWAVTEFAFFSQSRTKMDTYIMPSFAPLAIVVSWKLMLWARDYASGDESRKRSRWLFLSACIIGLAAIAAAAGPVALLFAKQLSPAQKIAFTAACLSMVAGSIFFVINYRRGKLQYAFYSVALALVVGGILATPFAFQMGSKQRWDDLRIIAEHQRGKDVDLALFDTFRPAVMFYSQKPVDSFFHAHQLEPGKGEGRTQLVIASDKTVHRLFGHPGLTLKPVERSGSWGIYEAVNSRLRKNLTLEEVFKQPEAFQMSITGKGEWGPLTVPYAAGDPEKWLGKRKNL